MNKAIKFSLKRQCHEIERQLGPLLYSLGLNNPPRICFTHVKSRALQKYMTHQTGGLLM
jgi:hypothetical protein